MLRLSEVIKPFIESPPKGGPRVQTALLPLYQELQKVLPLVVSPSPNST